jgi:MFS family permease
VKPPIDAVCAEASYPKPAYAWFVVALLFGAAIISYTDRQVLSLLVDPVRRDLNISDTQVSLLIGSAFAVIYGFAGIPLGYLADRTSRRNLIAGGMLIWSMATISCGFVHSFRQFFAARVLVGLGEAVLSPAAVSLISDYFPPSRRATALGAYFTGIAIGIGSAILIGGGLLHAINRGMLNGTALSAEPPWRLVFMLIGVPGLIWLILIRCIREPVRRQILAGGRAPASPEQASRDKARADRLQLIPIFVAVAMASFADNAIAAWSPSLLIRDFHRSAADVGVTLGTLFMIGGAAGMMVGGVCADRAQRTGGWYARVRICLVAAFLNGLALTLIEANNYPATLIAVAVTYFMSGVMTSTGLTAILDLVPNRRRGTATSVSFFLNVAIGAGIGPTAVALTGSYLFGGDAGLRPALFVVTEAAIIVMAASVAFALYRHRQTHPALQAAPGDYGAPIE